MINRKHVGQSFEDFFQEEGIYEQVQLNALKKTLAHQIKAMMEERGIPKTEMASHMNASRSSLDRFLGGFLQRIHRNNQQNGIRARQTNRTLPLDNKG